MTGNIMATTVAQTEQVTLDATGDKFVFFPGKPVDIVRWGFNVTVAVTGTGLVIAGDSQLKGAARGAGDVGTITAGAAVGLNDGMYTENVSPGVTAHPTEPFQLDAGEGVIFEVTGAATAGDGVVWVEYHERSFTGDSNQTQAQGNRIANMTQKTS